MAEDTEGKEEELSMEDILSSIKDILTEDNAEQHKTAQKEEQKAQTTDAETPEPAPVEAVDDVLTLSPAMIVEPNISTADTQPKAGAEEGADPLDLDFEHEFDDLSVEPVSGNDEAEHSEAIDEEPVDLSEIAAAEDIEIEKSSELPDLNFNDTSVDVNAEPIFSEEDDASHQENFTAPADDLSLDNLVDDDTLNAILNAAPDEAEQPVVPAEEELVEPTDNVYDNAVAEAVKEPEVIDADFVETADEPEAAEAEKGPEDPIDVSAGIISNFAKMFAEQQKQKEAPADKESIKEKLTAQTMSEIELGDGSLTIEAIVRDVVTGIVEKNLSKDFDFSAVASAEITRQTKEWLNAHLPEIVEAAVKKEIERVMAKVSSQG